MMISENSDQPGSIFKRLQVTMRRHPLFFFFLMAYAFSWIVSIPYILAAWGYLSGDFTIVFVLKAFAGPFLAAFIMTGILEGKTGVARLRIRLKQGSASWKWYLFILLGIPAMLMLGIVIMPGALGSFQGLKPVLLLTYPLYFVLVFFGGGPLAEEPGWRGFALPRMQLRYGPLGGTLLLGVLWTFWHLPDFLTPAQGGGPGTTFANFLTNLCIFFLLAMGLAVIHTWVYNHTQGSIFMVILTHAGVNTPQLVLLPLFPGVDWIHMNLGAMLGFLVPALLLLILTRGRLGYQPQQSEPLSRLEAEPRANVLGSPSVR